MPFPCYKLPFQIAFLRETFWNPLYRRNTVKPTAEKILKQIIHFFCLQTIKEHGILIPERKTAHDQQNKHLNLLKQIIH